MDLCERLKRKSRDDGSMEWTPSPPDINVLVVDDDSLTLLVLEAMFKACFYRVKTCDSGDEALRIVTNEQVDLVLLDMRMPGISGDKLLAMLHERKPELPVIVMSSSEERESVGKCVNLGAVSYLVKPLEMRTVKSIWQYVWKANKEVEAKRTSKDELSRDMAMMQSLRLGGQGQKNEGSGNWGSGVAALSGVGSSSGYADVAMAVAEHKSPGTKKRVIDGSRAMTVAASAPCESGCRAVPAHSACEGAAVEAHSTGSSGEAEALLIFTWAHRSDRLTISPPAALKEILGYNSVVDLLTAQHSVRRGEGSAIDEVGDENSMRLRNWMSLMPASERSTFGAAHAALVAASEPSASSAASSSSTTAPTSTAPAVTQMTTPTGADAPAAAPTAPAPIRSCYPLMHKRDGWVHVEHVSTLGEDGVIRGFVRRQAGAPTPPQGAAVPIFIQALGAFASGQTMPSGFREGGAAGFDPSPASLLSVMCERIPHVIVALSADGTLLATNFAAQDNGLHTGDSFFAHPLCQEQSFGKWRWKAHLNDVLAGEEVRFEMTCAGRCCARSAAPASAMAQESTLLLVTMAPLRRPDHHIRVVIVEVCDITSVESKASNMTSGSTGVVSSSFTSAHADPAATNATVAVTADGDTNAQPQNGGKSDDISFTAYATIVGMPASIVDRHILVFCDPRDLCRMAQVCSTLTGVRVEQNSLWRAIALQRWKALRPPPSLEAVPLAASTQRSATRDSASHGTADFGAPGSWKARYRALLGAESSWRTGKVVGQRLDGHRASVCGAAYVGGDSQLEPRSMLLTYSADGSIKLWDRKNGLMLQWVWPSGLQGSSVICGGLINVDGASRVLTVQRTGTINSWDAPVSRRWAAQLPGTVTGPLEQAQLYENGRRLLTLGDDGVAHEWRFEHSPHVVGGKRPAGPVGSNPFRTFQAPSSARPEVQEPDLLRFRHLRTYHGIAGQRWTAMMPSDWCSLVAMASQDCMVHFIDSERGQIARSFRGHSSRVCCLQMQHNFEDGLDGLAGPCTLLSGGHDKTVRLWDPRIGEGVIDSAIVMEGHVGSVNAIGTFGEYNIVSGSSDNTVICWDVRQQQCLYRIHVHGNGVRCLDFDGLSIACGTYDGSVTQLNFRHDELFHDDEGQ